MSTTPGTSIGRYRIEALLGQGGMGQVFRAWDEVLHRRVALKVLRPAGQARGATVTEPTVRRILHEARMVAALTHPNVVAVFDFGEHEGAPYIVMEHVSGAALRTFIGRGEVPVEGRVQWLADVARALSAAHHAGLVHRDVKPENVMVRDDGVVKVLDFGIARRATVGEGEAAAGEPAAGRPPGAGPAVGASPLDTLGTLEEGNFAGTPAYMAPEQLRVGQVDARADQFGWGVMAYEVLTGALPWRGGTEIAAVLRDVLLAEPAPLDAAALGVPAGLAAVVHRALRKAPEERFPSMDALLAAMSAGAAGDGVQRAPAPPVTPGPAIEEAATMPFAELPRVAAPAPAPSAAVAPPRRRGGAIAVGFGGAVLLAATGAVVVMGRRHAAVEPAPSSVASAVAAPTFRPRNIRRLTFQQGCEEFPSLPPDGREVYFDATVGKDNHLFALELATGHQRAVTTEHGWQWAAAVSPDGRTLAYLRQQGEHTAAHLLPVDGGAPPRLLAQGSVRPSWSADGRAVWAGDYDAPVRVDAQTAAVTRTLRPPEGYGIVGLTELADGRVLARPKEHEVNNTLGIVVYAPGANSDPTWITRDQLEEAILVAPGGRAVIAARVSKSEQIELMLYPLDGGAPAPLSEKDVAPRKGLEVSRAGDRVVWSNCASRGEIVALARKPDGHAEARSLGPQTEWSDESPAWVPGAKRVVVVSDRTEDMRLWMLDRTEREAPRQIPIGALRADAPAVSPDGRWVVFTAIGAGLHVVPADGSAPPRRLTSGPEDTSACFSRDGGTVYFQGRGEDGHARVDAVPLDGGAPPRRIRADAGHPATALGAEVLGFVALDGGAEEGVPMVLDLRTGVAKALSAQVGRGLHPKMRFSRDARRVAVLEGVTGIVEVDVASGAVVSRYDSGVAQITGITYVGDELLVTQGMWSGDLWVGDDPFR